MHAEEWPVSQAEILNPRERADVVSIFFFPAARLRDAHSKRYSNQIKRVTGGEGIAHVEPRIPLSLCVSGP